MMKVSKKLKMVLGVTIGNMMIAFSLNTFYLPNDLAVAGSTGVGLIIYRNFGIDPSISIFIINMFLLALGWILVGKSFVITSVLGSFLYPLFLRGFQFLPSMDWLVQDKLTGTICAGLMTGIGVGLTLRVGSSTGGSDTFAVICNRVFHVPIPIAKIMADYGVLLLLFTVITPGSIVYSLLALGIEFLMINRVMLLGRAQLQLLVMTSRYQEIRDMLLLELETGVTMLQAETGYRKDSCQVVLCVIPNRKLYTVKERILMVDPGAFFIVAEVKEVRGQGFSCERIRQDTVSPTEIA